MILISIAYLFKIFIIIYLFSAISSKLLFWYIEKFITDLFEEMFEETEEIVEHSFLINIISFFPFLNTINTIAVFMELFEYYFLRDEDTDEIEKNDVE